MIGDELKIAWKKKDWIIVNCSHKIQIHNDKNCGKRQINIQNYTHATVKVHHWRCEAVMLYISSTSQFF